MEEKLKEAFRLKLSDFCKTWYKKSSPDLFTFYVVLAGRDKVTYTGRATMLRRKSEAQLN